MTKSKFGTLLVTLLLAASQVYAEPSKEEFQKTLESPLAKRLNANPKSLSGLYAMYQASSRVGGKRFGEATPKHLPTGSVHLRNGKLLFPFEESDKVNGAILVITGPSGVVFQQTVTSQTIFVPQDRLRRGITYEWTCKGGTTLLQSKFQLIDSADNKFVEDQYAEIQISNESEQTKLWLAAYLFGEWDLYSARDSVFVKLSKY